MPRFFQQVRTGRIYHDHKRLETTPGMRPIYGNFDKSGVFIENDPQNDMVSQIQGMDNEEEIQDLTSKKFDIKLTGGMPIVKVKALELVRKWEALKTRIADMTDDQIDNLPDDHPVAKVAKEDKSEEDDKNFDPDYRENKKMHEWSTPELKDYIKGEHGISGRKLNFKKQEELLSLARDLDKVRDGKP